MEHVVAGFVSFRMRIFPKHRELFAELANGQSPEPLDEVHASLLSGSATPAMARVAR